MSENDLKDFVSHVTGYEVTKMEKINEHLYKVFVKGSVYPHHRFDVSNQLPITLSVTLEEGWE